MRIHLPRTLLNNMCLTNMINIGINKINESHFLDAILYPLLNPIKLLHLYNKYQPQANQNDYDVKHIKPLLPIHQINSSRSCLPENLNKAIIHCSALPTRFLCISNLPLLWFQTLGMNATSNKPFNYLNLPSLISIATSLLIHRSLIHSTKTANKILSLVPFFW